MGCHTFNIWQTLYTVLSKLINTVAMGSTATAEKRKVTKNSNDCVDENDCDNGDENDDDADLDVDFAVASQTSKRPTRKAAASQLGNGTKPNNLSLTNSSLQDIC
jgi:hypothetical protein